MWFLKKRKENELKKIDVKSNDIVDLVKKTAENGILSVPKDNNHNTFGDRLDKLTPEGELPFGWYVNNKGSVEPYEKALAGFAASLENQSVEEKVETLKKMIEKYYSFKAQCYKKNECYKKYFQDMWEHCRNSKCADFEYIKPYEEKLEELFVNYNELIEKEKIVNSVLPNLKTELLEVIENQSQGILQTDIYKIYDEVLKEYIREELYYMEKNGVVERKKQGRTYLLLKRG